MQIYSGASPVSFIYRGPDRLWVAPPSALFAVGGVGLWLDPSKRASLSQDSAGSVPVTAAGQPVGRILDQSGGGRHATQSTNAARPTYRLDIYGRAYLEFDGVDDWMTTASMALAAGGRTVIAALQKRSDASIGTVVETGPDWSTTPGAINLIAPATVATGNYGSRTRPAANPANLNSASSFAAPHMAVLSLRLATGNHVLRVNGVALNGAQPVEQHRLVPGVQRHLGSVTLGLVGQNAGQFRRNFRGRRSAAGKMDGHFGISGESEERRVRRRSLCLSGLALPAPPSTSLLPDPSVRCLFPGRGR